MIQQTILTRVQYLYCTIVIKSGMRFFSRLRVMKQWYVLHGLDSTLYNLLIMTENMYGHLQPFIIGRCYQQWNWFWSLFTIICLHWIRIACDDIWMWFIKCVLFGNYVLSATHQTTRQYLIIKEYLAGPWLWRQSSYLWPASEKYKHLMRL